MRTLATLVVAVLLVAVAPAGAVTAPAVGQDAAMSAAVSTAQQDCSFPVSRVDATGTEVTVEEDPDRVVVLAPSAAQTLWELDEAESVVGLPTGSTTAYLEGAENRSDVTNPDGSVNRERVVGLQPDLVIAPNIVPNETVSQLRNADLTVYKVGFGKSLDAITTKVSLFGRLTGACDRAATVNDEFNSTLAELRADAPETPPRAYYYFYNFTTGSGTFIHEAVETAGGENVAASAGVTGFKPVNAEIVADRNPQWIIRPDGSPLPSGPPWEGTDAYRLNQTLTVNDNLISQPGPRVIRPMRNMSEAFQSTERTSDGTTTPDTPTAPDDGGEEGGDTPTADDGADSTGPDGDGEATPGGTTTGGQPGFGPAAVVVAAALAALALARRD
jgi:iron complex transport system substrate-binding protein